ncbi:MAG: hypothetical protein ACRD3V_21845, partial [Vicinamibacteria bacterium]
EAEAEAEATTEGSLIDRLSERLKAGKPRIHAIVSRHHRADVEEEGVRLIFLPEERFFAEQLLEKSVLSLVEEQLTAVAGRKLRIAVEVLENGGKPTESHPEMESKSEPSGAGLEERARQDPLVKRFVETFQGEVEDVRSSDGSRS